MVRVLGCDLVLFFLREVLELSFPGAQLWRGGVVRAGGSGRERIIGTPPVWNQSYINDVFFTPCHNTATSINRNECSTHSY